jgi:hypothetical protein
MSSINEIRDKGPNQTQGAAAVWGQRAAESSLQRRRAAWSLRFIGCAFVSRRAAHACCPHLRSIARTAYHMRLCRVAQSTTHTL